MRRVTLGLILAVALLALATFVRPGAGRAQSDTPPMLWRCFYITCQTLHGVALTSAGEGWAVGAAGTILRLNGSGWTIAPSPTKLDLFGVWFASPGSGWAVGGYGGDRVALYWDGATWTPAPFAPTGEMPPGSPNAPRAISGWGDNLWMVGERGVAFQWLDDRWVWRGRVVNKDLRAIQMVGPREAWAVGGQREELSTTSEAAHLVNDVWLPVVMPTVFGQQVNYTALHFVSADEGWAVGEYYDVANGDFRGVIVHYTAATGWRLESVSAAPMTGVTMLSRRDGWAVGWRYGLYGPSAIYLRYVDGVWFPAPGTASVEPLAIDAVGNGGWAVGYAGAMLRLDGSAWHAVGLEANNNLRGVAFDGATGWAMGAGGVILKHEGTAWASSPRPSSLTLNAVALRGGGGWAVGSAGTILRLSQGTWQAAAAPLPVTLNGVALTAADTGWAVGNAGTLLRLNDSAWSVIMPTVSVNLYAVALSDDSGWAVGERQADGSAAILQLQSGEWRRAPSPTGQPLYSVSLVGATGWAVGANGIILHLIDGQWRVSGGPANDSQFTETLFGVYAESPDRAWAVGANGALLEYRNGAWLHLPAVSRDTLYAVAGGPGAEATAVGAYGAIARGIPLVPRQYLPLLVRGDAPGY